jgi:hypothetical protein
MPRQALGESEYFGCTLASKICDNEHAAAALGHSEPLSVQHSPCDVTRPKLCHLSKDGGEVRSLMATESADDVLPEQIA